MVEANSRHLKQPIKLMSELLMFLTVSYPNFETDKFFPQIIVVFNNMKENPE